MTILQIAVIVIGTLGAVLVIETLLNIVCSIFGGSARVFTSLLIIVGLVLLLINM
jgi:hypothetical protein